MELGSSPRACEVDVFMAVLSSPISYRFALAAGLSLALVYAIARGIVRPRGARLPNERFASSEAGAKARRSRLLVSALGAWLLQMPDSLGYFVLLLAFLSAVLVRRRIDACGLW